MMTVEIVKRMKVKKIDLDKARGVYPKGGWESNLPHF